MRARRTPLLVGAAVLFLAASLLTARFLSAENRERNLVVELLRAQAKGDAAQVISRLDRCSASAACVAEIRSNVRRVRRPGEVQVVRLDSETAHALGGAEGITRVVWNTTQDDLTVVQCIHVRRTGTALRGRTIVLSGVGPPIRRLSSCRI